MFHYGKMTGTGTGKSNRYSKRNESDGTSFCVRGRSEEKEELDEKGYVLRTSTKTIASLLS